jgi:hypothetical protein
MSQIISVSLIDIHKSHNSGITSSGEDFLNASSLTTLLIVDLTLELFWSSLMYFSPRFEDK